MNRVAYLVEGCEVDERGPVATGRFGCSVEPGADAAEGLTLAEAVDWGRSRAERVLVRIVCEPAWSAGSVALPDPTLDISRVLGRRRPAGWEFLDRADSEPPISWDVIVEVGTPSAGRLASGGTRTDLGERWRAALERSDACELVELTTTGSDGQVRRNGRAVTTYATTRVAVLRVESGGLEGAIRAAIAAAGVAAATARWEPAPAFSVEHLFATGSHAARRNAHLGTHGIRA